MTTQTLTTTVPRELAGERLDRALGLLFKDHSRSAVQRWIREGAVRVDGATALHTRTRVAGGERVSVEALQTVHAAHQPEALALDLLFEDEELLVVNKPPGLVVHPGAGNPTGTLLNALLHHHPPLALLPRAGLVHRIDKNTSGALVVAKTARAQTRLAERISAHRVERHYCAVVHGHPPASGSIEGPIGRHPRHRTRMSVRPGGRPSITHYRTSRRYRHHALVELRLETGRTHQIRVHLSDLGFAILGDGDYGGLRPARAGTPEDLAAALAAFRRQALHAHTLAFEHPHSAVPMRFSAELPDDLVRIIALLESDAEPGR